MTTSEKSSTSSPADIIKGWKTDRLIKFLRSDKNFKDLGLNDGFFTKLEDEKIT
ncbi:18764_t:CDS:1, partial [Funneliformis geosporum]